MPEIFDAAVADLHAAIAGRAEIRRELSVETERPPQRLAPHAVAFAAAVTMSGTEVGWGRFVLLYDPDGQDGWVGPFRIIAYIRAELEPEIATDPLIGQVGWTWLTDALADADAGYAAPSGTVTRVVTEGFGAKGDEPVGSDFELRASWSPLPGPDERLDLGPHLIAWSETLCGAAGLPPVTPGVAHLRSGRPRQP